MTRAGACASRSAASSGPASDPLSSLSLLTPFRLQSEKNFAPSPIQKSKLFRVLSPLSPRLINLFPLSLNLLASHHAFASASAAVASPSHRADAICRGTTTPTCPAVASRSRLADADADAYAFCPHTSQPLLSRRRLRLPLSPLEVPPTPSSPEALYTLSPSLFRVRPSDLSLHVLCEVRGKFSRPLPLYRSDFASSS
ncbi:hypothetical protein BT93_F2592 [Corymbia citriodora subsp. variegata]|nr:hypothetical protein BT93_F2592 [Corymbia citriodora subsp. variegata]